MAVSPNSLARRWSEHQNSSLVLARSRVIIPMITRTIRQAPLRPDATDDAPHVSRAAPTRTDRSDAGQPPTDLATTGFPAPTGGCVAGRSVGSPAARFGGRLMPAAGCRLPVALPTPSCPAGEPSRPREIGRAHV